MCSQVFKLIENESEVEPTELLNKTPRQITKVDKNYSMKQIFSMSVEKLAKKIFMIKQGPTMSVETKSSCR